MQISAKKLKVKPSGDEVYLLIRIPEYGPPAANKTWSASMSIVLKLHSNFFFKRLLKKINYRLTRAIFNSLLREIGVNVNNIIYDLFLKAK